MASESGKQRSQRIQIDYYRHRTGLDRLRSACVIAGLVGGGLYAVYVLAAGGGSHLSTGPLAKAHAAFENDCEQCHQEFTPIDSRGSRLDWKLVGLNPAKSIAHTEAACHRCHPVGDHHRDVMNPQWQLADKKCVTCHTDHVGRDHNLVAVSTRQCISCHANLAHGCTAEPKVRAGVDAFNRQQHGDFASLTKPDGGVVKFDHAQHMRRGQVNSGEKGAFTIGMLDPSVRDRYRLDGQDDSAPVALDCSSCHKLAGNPARVDSLPFDNELGRYMAPISFDKHCSACHSMNPGVATPDTTPLPHAVAWAKIDLLLAASLKGARATGQTRAPRDDTQSTPQPGEGPGNPAPARVFGSAVEIAKARKLVEAQCLQCHDEASITDESIAAARQSDPMIPARWLTHGLYDHGIHRQIDCAYCHEQAYRVDDSPRPPSDHETVMIAGIDSCTGCHRGAELPTPSSISSPAVKALLGDQPTWASDSCMLCHRYHTPPDRGIGSIVSASVVEASP